MSATSRGRISKIERAEGFTPDEVIGAVECFMRDADLANAYLALSSPDLGAAVIRREITRSRGKALPFMQQALVIAKIEKDERFAPAEVVRAVECVASDSDIANTYLALSNPDLGAAIIRRAMSL